jgi:ABC-type multidrug transport system fused ATPase/permease subunit
MARLVVVGFGQAAVGVVTVLAMPRLLEATTTPSRLELVGVLAGGAVLLGVLRAYERVVAERLGQDYAQEIRVSLVRSSLTGDGPSVGVTIARVTNDLTSVRNWVAQGITPLSTGIPLIVGAIVALYVLEPLFALAVGIPTLGLVATLAVLSRIAFVRSRELRRRRGQLAAHVADTVHAAGAIRVAGGVHREVRNVGQAGEKVVAAAVSRARVAGAIRGSAAAFASLTLVAIAAVGSWTNAPASSIATALTVVGLLATPVSDLGRVVEFRQSFRAASRILGPALAAGRRWERGERAAARAQPATATTGTGVQVTDVVLDGHPVPDLHAAPGDRVLVRGRSAATVRRFLLALAGDAHLDEGESATVLVDGLDLHALPAQERRLLVGYAARGQALERGTLARALRYRDPDSDAPVDAIVASVGLTATVDRLPKGERTTLTRGGEPLDQPDRARVLLGRAVFGDPPLVVLDHLDNQLSQAGRDDLRRVVAAFPGVVVMATDDAGVLGPRPVVWDLDAATDGHDTGAERGVTHPA